MKYLRLFPFPVFVILLAAACSLRSGPGVDPRDTATERGFRLLDEGKPSFAMGAFREALDIDPNHAPAHYGLGRVFIETGYTEGAESEFRRATSIRPGYGDAYLGLASLDARAGRYGEAERNVREAERLGAGGSTQGLYLRGLLAERRGSLEEAEARYREALHVSPGDTDVRLAFVDLLLGSGRYGEALQELERERFPRGREDEIRLRLADSRLHLGQDLEAERLYRQIAVARPFDRTAAEGLVVLALRRSDAGEARRALEDLAKLLPPDEGRVILDVAGALGSPDPFFSFLSRCREVRDEVPEHLGALLGRWIRELERESP